MSELATKPVITRAVGVALALLAALLIEPDNRSWLHALALPLLMALGAYLAAQNLLVVAAIVGALAWSATNLDSSDVFAATAYPALAGACAVAVAWLLISRLRQRAKETHEERWRDRRAESSDKTASSD